MKQNLGYIRFNILKIVRKLASLFNFLIFCMRNVVQEGEVVATNTQVVIWEYFSICWKLHYGKSYCICKGIWTKILDLIWENDKNCYFESAFSVLQF